MESSPHGTHNNKSTWHHVCSNKQSPFNLGSIFKFKKRDYCSDYKQLNIFFTAFYLAGGLCLSTNILNDVIMNQGVLGVCVYARFSLGGFSFLYEKILR